MNGWTRRRRNGCQKYIASVHPLPTRTRGLTWRRDEDGKIGLKRKKTSTGEMVKEKGGRRGARKRAKTEGRGGGESKLRSLSILFPFISLCAADDGARRVRARQKISKIRRPVRRTVRRAIRCRIYKERRRDLCRTVGYLSVSMVHAISLHGYRYVLSTSEAESPSPPLLSSIYLIIPSLSLRIYPVLLLDLPLALFLSFFIF